jgi:DNA-binding transcriptional regulator YhcF (GntR family)
MFDGIDGRSPIPVDIQLVLRVRYALLLGDLHPGDELPTPGQIARRRYLNPAMTMRGYRELEAAGIIEQTSAGWTVSQDAITVTPIGSEETEVRDLVRDLVQRAAPLGIAAKDLLACLYKEVSGPDARSS